MGRLYNRGNRFFENIDSEQKAYWLGFIYADGYVLDNVFGINLAAKDREHLEAFKLATGIINPIHSMINQLTDENGITKFYPGVRVQVNDPEMINYLSKLGVREGKTYNVEFPDKNQVPKNLMSHFIRGFFDGDGCICHSLNGDNKWKFNILARKDFSEHIFGILMRYVNPMHLHIRQNEQTKWMSYVACDSFPGLLAIRNFLYKDATIWLKRKKDKFDLLPKSQTGRTDICRKLIPRILAESQEAMNPKQILLEIQKIETTIHIRMVQTVLNELNEYGIVSLNRINKMKSFYTYEFEEQEDDPLRFAS